LHVQLALLRKLRERAQSGYAAAEMRKQQKEADFAWLVRASAARDGGNGGLS
jgi:hypothetical protein